jgi:hypothetical protein
MFTAAGAGPPPLSLCTTSSGSMKHLPGSPTPRLRDRLEPMSPVSRRILQEAGHILDGTDLTGADACQSSRRRGTGARATAAQRPPLTSTPSPVPSTSGPETASPRGLRGHTAGLQQPRASTELCIPGGLDTRATGTATGSGSRDDPGTLPRQRQEAASLLAPTSGLASPVPRAPDQPGAPAHAGPSLRRKRPGPPDAVTAGPAASPQPWRSWIRWPADQRTQPAPARPPRPAARASALPLPLLLLLPLLLAGPRLAAAACPPAPTLSARVLSNCTTNYQQALCLFTTWCPKCTTPPSLAFTSLDMVICAAAGNTFIDVDCTVGLCVY